MGYTVTSTRRRLAMAAMLLLAISGGLIRRYAPNPSTFRDVGSLLLVMWLPAVGNLIAYVITKIPRSPPPVTEFAPGSVFRPHIEVTVEAVGTASNAVDHQERRCTLLVGRHGFTARTADPLGASLAAAGAQTLVLELLHPGVALRKLTPGTAFHLLQGTTAVAKGSVSRTC